MLTTWVHSQPKQASTTVSRPNSLRYQMSVHIIMTQAFRRFNCLNSGSVCALYLLAAIIRIALF